MAVYKTPDVYVEEISTLPPSVAEVATAIPAFIGYTAIAPDSPSPVPLRITSFLEFITYFGGPAPVHFKAVVKGNVVESTDPAEGDTMQQHKLYYALDFFFKNGGSDCYIVSLGTFRDKKPADFAAGINALITEDEPTLIVLSEAADLPPADYYTLCQQALAQCASLQDRFCILDVPPSTDGKLNPIAVFRDNAGANNLKYGAAYYPYLNTSINQAFNERNVSIATATSELPLRLPTNGLDVIGLKTGTPQKIAINNTGTEISFSATADTLTISAPTGKTAQEVFTKWMAPIVDPAHKAEMDAIKKDFDLMVSDPEALVEKADADDIDAPLSLQNLKLYQTGLYNTVKQEMGKRKMVLPPSPAIAGVYASTDRTRGVWKAPANVSLNAVIGPTEKISASSQEILNVDDTGGKSINAIRSFTGKGTLVWGARTLAGNDNEWRYVSVRRLFIMIEESAKKASYFAVFEPNDAATWLKVKGMIESFLYGLWQQGALAGSTSKAAYYVNVGLGSTMTSQDILEGRMIVEIGVAAVRPAEFIILRFSHKLQEA